MTSQGSDYGRFQRAIAAGNGPAAFAAASDVGTLQLADALSLTLLLVGQGELFERCAGRWLSRFGAEVSRLRVQDCALAAVALQAVGSGSVAGGVALAELCEQRGRVDLVEVLEGWVEARG